MGLISDFKKRTGGMIDKIKAADEKKGYESNEFYYPERDKDGTANVVLRFLPQPDPEALPYVTVYKHGFKGDDGKWLFADLCATTLNKECEICKRNGELWDTGIKENQEIVRERKRKKEYVCNVLVLKDPKNPEKEGQVFPFRFGPAIYNKIMSMVQPKYEGDPSINPFDLWEGADFLFRVRRDNDKKGQTTYEDSKFANPSELYNGDTEKLEEIISKCISLDKYIDESKIIPEDELKKKCDKAYSKCLGSSKDVLHANEIKSEEPESHRTIEKANKESIEFNSEPHSASETSVDDALAEFESMVNSL